MILSTNTFAEAADAPPLAIAHGLFGSARNWGVIAKRLAAERPVITLDMRNHAGSGWADAHSYEDLAGDLHDTLAHLPGPLDVLGHSMGGKAAMVLALTQPHLVRRLIVADIAPVAYSHDQHGPITAMRNVKLAQVEKRQDAADQMKGIEDDLKPFLREMQGQTEAQLFLCNWYAMVRDRYHEIFEEPEDHAGEMETSLALAYFPDLVRRTDDGALQADNGAVRPMRMEALNEGWVSITRPWHLLTTNSGSGNPHAATADKGQAVLDFRLPLG